MRLPLNPMKYCTCKFRKIKIFNVRVSPMSDNLLSGVFICDFCHKIVRGLGQVPKIFPYGRKIKGDERC